MSDDCEHSEVEIGSAANGRSGPDGDWLEMTISVRCIECGVHFSWAGLASGISNPHAPVLSADGYELRAPIIAAPGGYVGLLKMAGQGHRLGPDGPIEEAPE